MKSIMELENKSDITECPYCKCKVFIKYGKFNEVQRYKCKNDKCSKTFSSRTLSPWRYSKKTTHHWHKYMKLMESGSNLRQCAEKVNINLSTSFYWRHKILKVIGKLNEEIKLKGTVEIVKTMLYENHKGVRGSNREQRKKIMIISAMDNNNNIFSEVIGKMPCNQRKLENIIERKIHNNSYMNTYLDRNLSAIAKKHNVSADKSNKIELNKIMAYYIKQLAWLHRFKGVATNNLNRYLLWFSMVFS